MSLLDPLIAQLDQALRTVFTPAPTLRPRPGQDLPEANLDAAERRRIAALMRINHVGEICAQALYAGQAFAAQTPLVRQALRQAAWEETEHLNWTEQRIAQLGGRKSLLNPLWYAGAWSIGALAGRLGDPVSLGFLAETEHQVEAHLDSHLQQIPAADQRSRTIIEHMKTDEAAHAALAIALGAAELPSAGKMAMRAAAKLMTRTAYWV
jgi:ubiquinone biosynthesis monooxygenase Coq7